METESVFLLAGLIFAAALLYSSVGHAGASGYLAAMALFGLAPMSMKPAALALNVLVAVIAVSKYARVGAFSWRVFLPFALASTPFAFLGGAITLPSHFYKPLVGLVLVYAAWRFLYTAARGDGDIKTPPLLLAGTAGAGLGFLSGLTGVGGGIFLSPLLIFAGWAPTRVVSGVSAAFILVNSVAGLLGLLAGSPLTLPEGLPVWAVAAAVGGYIGAELGSRRLSTPGIRRMLAVVLALAGVKMVLTA